MKIHQVQQGSGEWLKARLGVVTASEADSLLTPMFKARTGEGVATYTARKVAEKVLGFSWDEGANSFHMEQGSILEGEAIPWLEFAHDISVQRVGFITSDDGRIGCSPDGLIGADGGIEVKCPSIPVHARYLLDGELPKDYAIQVHFSMYVTGRPWWLFLSYNRQFPALLLKVERDPKADAAIAHALELFAEDFDAKCKRLRDLRDAENASKST